MKTFLPLLLTSLVFSSCTTYQYLTISNTAAPNNGKQFTATDSSLQVTYLFDSINGRIGLVINNKLPQPVIIDWKKSSLITNGSAIIMYDNTIPFSATSTILPYSYPRTTGITGQAALPEGTDFIPPNAGIKRYTKTVAQNITDAVFTEKEKLVKRGTDYTEEKFKGRKFTETESPYKLRVYLTYVINNNTERVLETTFYASEIVTSTFDPEVMSNIYYKNQPLIYK